MNVTVDRVLDSPAPNGAVDKIHHQKNGKDVFHNPWPSFQEVSPEALKAHIKERDWFSTWTHPSIAEAKLPVLTPSLSHERFEEGRTDLRATWLGHACYLIEFPSGLRVLFDPVMTDRCSPVGWMGPRRFTRAPLQIQDIPIVDVVVISHNHYDHLSHPTVMEIHKLHPNAHFLVPLGNLSWFKSCGITQVTELDWWEEAEYLLSPSPSNNGNTSDEDKPRSISARISCLPAQHTTGRGLWGTNKTLWASWSVKSTSPQGTAASVYFAGDTGYRAVPTLANQDEDWDEAYSHLPVCPAFAQIGELYGPFDLGLFPIGAYEPRALSASIHANPRDAVEIFCDTKCKRGLAMHWGTWVLGDEDVRDPPRKLAAALAVNGMPEKGMFDACAVGESVLIPVE